MISSIVHTLTRAASPSHTGKKTTSSDNVFTNSSPKSTPLDNVARTTVATPTRDASATELLSSPSVDSHASQIFATSASIGRRGGSAFVPTPPKLIRGEPFLKSVQEEKSSFHESDDDIGDDFIRTYLGVNNAAAVAKEKEKAVDDDASAIAPSDSESAQFNTEDTCQDDDFFSSAAFLETVSNIREANISRTQYRPSTKHLTMTPLHRNRRRRN